LRHLLLLHLQKMVSPGYFLLSSTFSISFLSLSCFSMVFLPKPRVIRPLLNSLDSRFR
jgi:hypothetical protein